jgi:hypothetical protein
MSKPVIHSEHIENYRHDLEVIRNTAAQIIKDFELFGVEIKFSGDEYAAYVELKKQMVPILQNLHKTNFPLFNSLMYRIDVNEKKIKEALINYSGGQLSEHLVHLVIEREFTKVLFRKLYTQK